MQGAIRILAPWDEAGIDNRFPGIPAAAVTFTGPLNVSGTGIDDQLTGGAGADVVLYTSTTEMGDKPLVAASTRFDLIAGFDFLDLIDLSRIDAKGNTPGNTIVTIVTIGAQACNLASTWAWVWSLSRQRRPSASLSYMRF